MILVNGIWITTAELKAMLIKQATTGYPANIIVSAEPYKL